MSDGWTALLALAFAFCFGIIAGADSVKRACVRGDTVKVEGTPYRAHCVPEPERADE